MNSLTRFTPSTFDLAFKLRRKRFTVEKLHLPPDLAETAEREQDETSQSKGKAMKKKPTPAQRWHASEQLDLYLGKHKTAGQADINDLFFGEVTACMNEKERMAVDMVRTSSFWTWGGGVLGRAYRH